MMPHDCMKVQISVYLRHWLTSSNRNYSARSERESLRSPFDKYAVEDIRCHVLTKPTAVCSHRTRIISSSSPPATQEIKVSSSFPVHALSTPQPSRKIH